ncbi:hypothetical protein BG000_005496 [Podila horticola]|nr:hypothetical protein BG000_005496 [Podila horticola]
MPLPESFDGYAKMRRQFEETAAYWKHQRDYQDYQAANKPIDLILGNDSIVLSEIHIQGNNTTRSAFLRALLQPAIQATTLQACYGASKEAVERLQRLGIFDSVEMRLQPHRESSSSSSSSSDKDNNNNMDMDMDLILVVKEKKKLVFATGTAVDQHGVHLIVFSTPVWSPDRILSFEIFRQTLNNTDRSSYEEDQQGTAIRYQTRYVHTVHEVSYETTARDVCRLSQNASYLIRAQRGPSFKRALVHRWTLDTRDHVIASTRGHLVRLCQELAGFSKGACDAKYIKHEVESWSIAHLGAGVYLTNSFQAGYLKTLNGNPSNICDRYFVGNPITIRGIGPNDIGSHDQGDSLGGDAYVAVAVSLWRQLPRVFFSSSSRSTNTSTSNVKVNVFGSCGAMTRVFPGQSVASTIQELTLASTVAVGAGIAYFQPWGRFECNYTMPVVGGDLGRGKWQFGFGIDLL